MRDPVQLPRPARRMPPTPPHPPRLLPPALAPAVATADVQTALDQVVWGPVMLVVFFAVLKTLEGHPEAIIQVGDRLGAEVG